MDALAEDLATSVTGQIHSDAALATAQSNAVLASGTSNAALASRSAVSASRSGSRSAVVARETTVIGAPSAGEKVRLNAVAAGLLAAFASGVLLVV